MAAHWHRDNSAHDTDLTLEDHFVSGAAVGLLTPDVPIVSPSHRNLARVWSEHRFPAMAEIETTDDGDLVPSHRSQRPGRPGIAPEFPVHKIDNFDLATTHLWAAIYRSPRGVSNR